MGLYDTVILGANVELPQFPETSDPQSIRWQTKDLRRPSGATFKISDEGRLLRRETTYREKTDAEKQREASEHGFDGWDEYVTAVRNQGPERLDGDLPPIVRSQIEVDAWWADHNYHGTFEFYSSSPANGSDDITWSYEARFSRGSLAEIKFLGDRHSDGSDVVDE
jgi:hypothetical protein